MTDTCEEEWNEEELNRRKEEVQKLTRDFLIDVGVLHPPKLDQIERMELSGKFILSHILVWEKERKEAEERQRPPPGVGALLWRITGKLQHRKLTQVEWMDDRWEQLREADPDTEIENIYIQQARKYGDWANVIR